MEDDRPRPVIQRLNVLPLDELGIAELRDHVAALQAEIARTEAAIARKLDHRGAADAVFGTRGRGPAG